MKKLLVFILSMALILCLSACGTEADEPVSIQSEQPGNDLTEPEPEQEPIIELEPEPEPEQEPIIELKPEPEPQPDIRDDVPIVPQDEPELTVEERMAIIAVKNVPSLARMFLRELSDGMSTVENIEDIYRLYVETNDAFNSSFRGRLDEHRESPLFTNAIYHFDNFINNINNFLENYFDDFESAFNSLVEAETAIELMQEAVDEL